MSIHFRNLRLPVAAPVAVTYVGSMRMHEYLRSMVLEQPLPGIDNVNRIFDGLTVRCDFSVDGERVFWRGDKERLVSDVLKLECTVTMDPRPVDIAPLRGNAVPWDPDEECSICMSGGMNFQLECGHYFHAACLVDTMYGGGTGCPMCRRTICEKDENSMQLRVLAEVHMDRLEPDGGAVIDLTAED